MREKVYFYASLCNRTEKTMFDGHLLQKQTLSVAIGTNF